MDTNIKTGPETVTSVNTPKTNEIKDPIKKLEDPKKVAAGKRSAVIRKNKLEYLMSVKPSTSFPNNTTPHVDTLKNDVTVHGNLITFVVSGVALLIGGFWLIPKVFPSLTGRGVGGGNVHQNDTSNINKTMLKTNPHIMK